MVYSWKGALWEMCKWRIRTKKVLFFRATFEQLSLQKANFDGFLSNFWANFSRNYGKRFGKSRATCGKPHWWCHMITHDCSFFCCSAKQCPSHLLCVRVLVPFSPIYLDHDRSLLHPGYRCWDDCLTFAPCRRAACSAGGKRVCIGTINGW